MAHPAPLLNDQMPFHIRKAHKEPFFFRPVTRFYPAIMAAAVNTLYEGVKESIEWGRLLLDEKITIVCALCLPGMECYQLKQLVLLDLITDQGRHNFLFPTRVGSLHDAA